MKCYIERHKAQFTTGVLSSPGVKQVVKEVDKCLTAVDVTNVHVLPCINTKMLLR